MIDSANVLNEDVLLHLIEKLDGVLSESYSLQTAIHLSLEFVLTVTGRESGGLLPLERSKNGRSVNAWVNPSESWLAPNHVILPGLQALVDEVAETSQVIQGSIKLKDTIGYPVITDEKPLAVLVLSGGELKPEESVALKFLTRLIAQKIKYLQTHPMAVNREQYSSLLKSIATGLDPRLGLPEVELELVRGIAGLYDAEELLLVTIKDENDLFAERKVFKGRSDWYEIKQLPFERGLIRQCIAKKKILQWENPSRLPDFNPGVDSLLGEIPRTMACIPLIAEEKSIGALALINSTRVPLNNYDRGVLGTLGQSLAGAIVTHEKLQRLQSRISHVEQSTSEVTNSRNTLRVLFDNIPSSIYIIDRDYKIVAINKSRAERVDSTPKKLVGLVCHEALYNSKEICVGCQVAASLHNGHSYTRVERTWGKNDKVTDWEISSYAIFDREGTPIEAILYEQDITEKRRLEGDLIQSEKLAAIGQLAAGVAHEINNPLAAVIANSQILMREIPPDNEDLMESVKLIELAGLRASNVVKNLLGMARKDEYEFRPVDLNESIQDALSLLSHEFVARPVSIRFERSKGMPPVTASREHLQSVWINLVMNALEAIGDNKGEITINTFYDEGNFYILVKDTGSGIPAEQLGRIFEPFYTTKGFGRGTGLGLSVVQRIVKAHSGKIQVESEVDKGTTFTIILPENRNSS